MNFLPEDYQAPKSNGHYLKLQEGENRLRILSKPILGWEDWTAERKPVRFRMDEKPNKSIDPKKPLKHFWAFIVYNVNENDIQIMQITQATIRASIEALCKDADWGSPYEYDIKIIKKGEGIETEYSVNPAPHKPVSGEVLQAFKERPINLEALFISGDPFAPGWEFYTPLMTEAASDPTDENIGHDEFICLSELLQGCADSVKLGFKEYLKKAYGIDSLDNLKVKNYETIKNMLTIRFQENQKALAEAEMADTPESRKANKNAV